MKTFNLTLMRLFVLLLPVFAAVSCSSDDDKPAPAPKVRMLPATISYESTSIDDPGFLWSVHIEYSYDEQDRITSVDMLRKHMRHGNTERTVSTIAYDTQGRPASKRVVVTYSGSGNSTDQTYIINYSDNTVTCEDTPRAVFHLNSDGQLTKRDWHWDYAVSSKIYSYDRPGNLVYERVEPEDPYYNISYRYDDSAGAFCCVNAPQWFISHLIGHYAMLHLANNCIEERREKRLSKTYDYSFDENGYPTEISTTKHLDDSVTPTYYITYMPASRE